MTHAFSFFPAHADRPCIRAHGEGAVFSAVFRSGQEHGLQLIHPADGETFYIPLTEEYRTGRVYSVRITPFSAEEWLYRYKVDDLWVPDPLAREFKRTRIISEKAGSDGMEEVTACSCAPLRIRDLFPEGREKPLPPANWAKQVVYSIHVKGLTAARPASFPGRGTFAGVTAMIPYFLDLGITAVEIMPVYTPLPDRRGKKAFRTMQEALGAWPVGPQGDPLRDLKERPNYWGFGRGLYYALRPEYGSQKEFAEMVRALHSAGIRVLLQFYFEKGMLASQQLDVLRFYVEQYGIDGFHLMGSLLPAEILASTPSLSDTALFAFDFPFAYLREAAEEEEFLESEELENLGPRAAETDPEEENDTEKNISGQFPAGENPAEGNPAGRNPAGVNPAGRAPAGRSRRPVSAAGAKVLFPNLITCGEDFQTLLRRFVKSDDYVMKDFLKEFLAVPNENGALRTVTTYEGFTLADLVSYSERHNEANGEFGLDGRVDNHSWNCGAEGETDDAGILALRRRQVRNFLTLLLLSQGTPLLRQGDERFNSQGGNNNPYCQDNEISWVDWERSREADSLTAFTARLLDFRREHPVFCSTRSFQYIDTLGIGSPDLSLHGEEAWKPDLGPCSHSIGIAFCENYADGLRGKQTPPAFVYLAVNMYWEELSLALPRLSPGYIWKVCLDTNTEEGFAALPFRPEDQRSVNVAPRSIRILRSFPDLDAITRGRREERLAGLPSSRILRRLEKKKTNSSCDAQSRRICGRTPAAVRRTKRMTGIRH